jgi:hypothetical protein
MAMDVDAIPERDYFVEEEDMGDDMNGQILAARAESVGKLAQLQKAQSSTPYVMIFCIDLLIPLMLILSAISAMSFTGILFVLLLYLHVIVANRIRKSWARLRTCLIVDFVVNFIVFVWASVSYVVEFDSEVIRVIGLDFNNFISSTPTLNLVTSLVAMICQTVCLLIMRRCSISRVIVLRTRMFSSLAFQFGMDFTWAVCNAFNAASNSSYLYLPILIYFVWSNIWRSWVGNDMVPSILLWLVMCYSLFFGIFELYAVSYIGEKWDPSKALRYIYIAPNSSKAANVVIAVVFAFISVQQMTAPGLSIGQKPVPAIFQVLSDQILILAFIATFLFGVVYPNYLSVTWLWIPFNASFASFHAVKKLFFPLLTIVFTLTFVTMALTTFQILSPPIDDGTSNTLAWLRLFGYFRYPKDFNFTCFGFFIICLLGQIGRIAHVPPTAPSGRKTTEEHPSDNELPEETRIIKQFLREERQARNERLKAKVFWFFSFLFKIIYEAFCYSAVGAILVVGILAGFYPDRYSFTVLSVIFMVIALFASYRKWIFQVIKFVTGIMIILAAFYKTTLNTDCRDGVVRCLPWDSLKWEDGIPWGFIVPPDMSLANWAWSLMVDYLLSTFLTGNPEVLSRELPPWLCQFMFAAVAVMHFFYMFLYETDVFVMIFCLVGIAMLTCQYLGRRSLLAIACCLSCIAVSVQLACLLLSHFEGPRDLITRLVPKSVVDISEVREPSGMIVLLAILLWLSTVALNSRGMESEWSFVVKESLYEIRVLLDRFYFYLCWIFIFAFSVVNSNPSVIKFILMLLFAFGRWSKPIFV